MPIDYQRWDEKLHGGWEWC